MRTTILTSRLTEHSGVVAAALVLAFAAGAVVLVGTGHRGGRASSAPLTTTAAAAAATADSDAATAWNDAASKAYGNGTLTAVINDLVQQYQDWKGGHLSDGAFRAAEATNLDLLIAIRDRVATLAPFAADPLVNDTYTRSAELYVEWARLTLDAARTPAGAVRSQLDLLSRRVEELGNRVFDRGVALRDVHLPRLNDLSVQTVLPEEVPEWIAEGLAAGPPLDAAPGPADAYPPVRADHRATEPRRAWIRAVLGSGAPAPSEVARDIATGDLTTCRDVAERLGAAVEGLRGVPDPVPAAPGRPTQEGREESARLRLGLEVDAEGARAAELAAVLRSGSAAGADPALVGRLITSGQRLLLIGASLWSSDLGGHDSGLDPSLMLAAGRF